MRRRYQEFDSHVVDRSATSCHQIASLFDATNPAIMSSHHGHAMVSKFVTVGHLPQIFVPRPEHNFCYGMNPHAKVDLTEIQPQDVVRLKHSMNCNFIRI